MELKFQVQLKIQKPISEVYDAVYNPKKIVNYFTTAVASDALDAGKTVLWGFADFAEGKPFPVKVEKSVKDELIGISWGANEAGAPVDYRTHTDFVFEKLSENETLIKISEGTWRLSDGGLKASYGNCQGWMNFACCLKAWLEYGINLRKGAF